MLATAPVPAQAHRTSTGHHKVTDRERATYVGLRHTAKKRGLRVGEKLSVRRSARMHGIYIRRLRAKMYGITRVPAHLQAIARCESGGNPRAVSPGGLYRGKYQFDLRTWASVGGKGDPAAASEAEQDRRAQILYARRGAQPWPVCGR